MIKVAVTGAAGRMGSGIIRKITEQDDMEVVAAIEIPNSPLAGKDAGLQAGTDELGVEIVGSEKLEETLKASKPDVLVDFTIAPAAYVLIAIETAKTAQTNSDNSFFISNPLFSFFKPKDNPQGRRCGTKDAQRRCLSPVRYCQNRNSD